MKMQKKCWIKAALLLLILGMGLTPVFAQKGQSGKDERSVAVKNMLTAKRYVFKPQTALPMGGSSRQLTQDFDLRVSGDTLQSYLPYFGRAFTAPINTNESGIRFTSTEFDYTVKPRKKGWDVVLVPKDAPNVRQMLLQVSAAGYASLVVTSNNRQSISFTGYVTENSRR